MTPQTTTSSGPAVSEGSTVSAASLAKIRALSASSDAVSGASSGGQGGKSISRLAVALIIGGVLLVLLCALSFAVGSRMFPLDRSIDGFLHPEANTIESKLIWAKRAPRTAAALLVGAALAVSGVLMQALSRNPLAEPGLLGVNSGAAASVVVGVGVFGVSSPFVQLWLALLGSGLAAALVFVMGLVDSKQNLDSTARLVLTGVAVNACLGTITGIITMFNSKAFDSHRFWVVGSLENRTFEQVLSALPFVALGLVLSFMLIGPLRALALGEDAAAGLGVPVTMVRGATIIAIMALCGAATAVAGPIGFVGLVVPHVVRLLVGSDIARVLPLSLVYGPVLVLASDILGRVLVMPSELEVGIVTAFIGAPVLMVLVLRLSTGARGAKKGRMGAKAQAHDESGPAHVSEHGPHRAQRPVARGSSGSSGAFGS
ncbi:iron ABC transporter permease [Rothia sp. HMSC061C12]|uniref:FecCD family ABC transporter permease n=1 Tax=Rothia sp. HMSC061C12 TaxID=1739547 RepID=UPI0008A6121E|nr:iron ABC transporter permease [Rothia sp. HMSC061C12]OFO19816.1 Fe3+-siderophore ABC transporter permease [Rothia sp. HMSC061C12]